MIITLRKKLNLELYVYNLAKHFYQNYNGGSWKFCTLGNYWHLNEDFINVCNPNNFFEEKMTCKSAGISLCLMACSNLSFKFYEIDSNISEFWSDYYYFLRSFAFSDAFSEEEKNQIFRFID